MFRTLLVALLATLAAAGSAQAAPTWLDETPPFGDVPAREDDAAAAMAPDGTVVVARFAPSGVLEVRERPPGGEFGATTTIPPVVQPQPFPNLQVLTGADGTAAVLFDVGNARFASVRPPGGRWPAANAVALAGAKAVLAGDGELWLAGRSLDDDRLAVYRRDGVILLPAPPAGSQDLAPALALGRDGGVHVLFGRARQVRGDDECVLETSVHVVDVDAAGRAGAVEPIDNFLASGGEDCDLDQGRRLQGPLLLTTDAAGADTALYSVLRLSDFTASVHAQHRDPGGRYSLDPPIEGDLAALSLVGGAGAPVASFNAGGDTELATRGGDGRWSTQSVGRLASAALARTGTGTVAFAGVEIGGRVVGRVLDRGVLSPPTELRARGTQVLGAGGDAEGNAVALFSADARLFANGYDAAGPRLTDLTIDPHARAGVGLPVIVSGLDVWSGPLRRATWDFGDGTQAEGVANGHTFAAPGRYTVTVTGRDDVGNTTSASGTVTAVAVPIPLVPTLPPRRDARAPRLTHLTVSRAGKLTLRLDEGARVKVVLTRGKTRRALTRTLRAGTRKITLPHLARGTWKLTVTATDRAGNVSRPRRLTVRVR